ncbi:hypothetical protein [Streptomyces sp. NPDC058674]|uniref:hypothetical protein n=1 Tax=Streptomyces sp. NPDC058674 TaxID=3346592 RepID=UPI0036660B3A
MRDQREEFARCAVALAAELHAVRHDAAVAVDPEDPWAVLAPTGDDPFAPSLAGREGIFDQALSNGLAAIVASEWPGKESDGRGFVLPARTLQRVDHLMHAEGAIGFALVEVAYDVADQFVIHHPEHDPWKHWEPNSPGQPKPWDGQTHSAPQYILEYPVFPPSQNIERRWTVEHPPPRSPAVLHP